MNNKQKLSAGALAALITLVGAWEGMKTKAYPDIIGVWTICYGYTHGVKKGDVATPEQCKTMLVQEIDQKYNEISKCIKRPLSDGQIVALTSLAYNAGSSAVCKSTALRLMNQGKKQEGCDALLAWRFAGGKEVQGLLNRRKAERKICLS